MNTAYRAFFVLSLPLSGAHLNGLHGRNHPYLSWKLLYHHKLKGELKQTDISFLQKKYSFYQTLHLCVRVTQKGRGFELNTLYIHFTSFSIATALLYIFFYNWAENPNPINKFMSPWYLHKASRRTPWFMFSSSTWRNTNFNLRHFQSSAIEKKDRFLIKGWI